MSARCDTHDKVGDPASAEGAAVEFRLLGPVELRVEDQTIAIKGLREQTLLAMLLLARGNFISTDTIIERLWDEPPPGAKSRFQEALSRLRRQLRRAGLVIPPGTANGYHFRVDLEQVDALRFIRLISAGLAAKAAGRFDQALRILREVRELWTVEPLTGLTCEWACDQRDMLKEKFRNAIVARADIEMRTGDVGPLIGDLTGLLADEPRDEQIGALLMRAYHVSGRRAEALAFYANYKGRLLRDGDGEPGPTLRKLHQAILRNEDLDISSAAGPQELLPTRPPHTLDPDAPDFVGREADTRRLVEAIKAADPDTVTMCVVTGMPGIGKTTFAAHVAHLIQHRCPDGQLQLNLLGNAARDERMDPVRALSLLLDELAPRHSRKDDLESMRALWRRETTGRRLLLLLDDAADFDQVKPLIPPAAGGVVLITSRRVILAPQNAIKHTMTELSDAEARQVFARSLSEDPAAADAIDRIVDLCRGLPLALSVAAGALTWRFAGWSAANIADRLERAVSVIGGEGDTLMAPLAAAFATSYAAVPELAGRILRRVPLHPISQTIGTAALAALAGVRLVDARSALDALLIHNMIREPAPDRFRVHDLVRADARARLNSIDDASAQEAALGRLVEYYIAALESAMTVFHPYHLVNLAPAYKSRPEPPSFPDKQAAEAWLNAECETLLSLTRELPGRARPRQAASIAHMLTAYLDRKTRWRDAATVHERALDCWVRVGSVLGQAYALMDLAAVHLRLHRLDDAQVHAEAAVELWRELKNEAGEAEALYQLGRIGNEAREFDQAIFVLRRSAAIQSKIGDLRGRAVTLYHLGEALCKAGRVEQGRARIYEALRDARIIGDEITQRNCLINLGVSHLDRREYAEALEFYSLAQPLVEKLNEWLTRVALAENKGMVYAELGDHEAALKCLTSAREMYATIEDPLREAEVLLTMHASYLALGRAAQAAQTLEDALKLWNLTEDAALIPGIERAVGDACFAAGSYSDAIAAYQRSLARAKSGSLLGQVVIHQRLAEAYELDGSVEAAYSHWKVAVDLAQRLQLADTEELRARLAAVGPATHDRTA
jgi:DNA-binding SARP family transcriptional activator